MGTIKTESSSVDRSVTGLTFQMLGSLWKLKIEAGLQIRSKMDSFQKANFMISQPNPVMLSLIGIVSERNEKVIIKTFVYSFLSVALLKCSLLFVILKICLDFFMGNDRLSGKQVRSQASCLVTWRLAWIQSVCISMTCVYCTERAISWPCFSSGFFMGVDRLSCKQVRSRASCLVTWRLAWIQSVCISITCVSPHRKSQVLILFFNHMVMV